PNTMARSCQHFGFVFFPTLSGTFGAIGHTLIAAAGQSTTGTFVNTAAAAMVAGNSQITLGGADTTTNIKVGAVVQFVDAASATYSGRVISIDTATKFSVWPPPVTTRNAVVAG